MTGEEMERSIEFLLNSQASLESQMERTNRQVELLGRRVEQVADQVEQVANQVEQVANQVGQMSVRLEVYAATQSQFMEIVLRHIETQSEINASFRRAINDLNGAQQRTEEKLSSLIETVDRYISEDRNGKA